MANSRTGSSPLSQNSNQPRRTKAITCFLWGQLTTSHAMSGGSGTYFEEGAVCPLLYAWDHRHTHECCCEWSVVRPSTFLSCHTGEGSLSSKKTFCNVRRTNLKSNTQYFKMNKKGVAIYWMCWHKQCKWAKSTEKEVFLTSHPLPKKFWLMLPTPAYYSLHYSKKGQQITCVT